MDSINNIGMSQQVQAPQNVDNTAKVAYQPKVDLSDPVDTVEFSKDAKAAKSAASTGKKIGVGVASALIPGVGQFINGDTAKGFGFMGANVLTNLVGFQLLGPVALIPSVAISVASIVDAVKNA